MKFFNKLERKYGKYAIKNLMYYIIILYVIGWFIQMFSPGLYVSMLSLNVEKVLQGQIWRLVTFIIFPPDSSVIFMIFALYLYYMIGSSLERVWGAFKFNVYFLMGVIFNILAAFVMYFAFDMIVLLTTYYINLSLFLAFACVYPDMELLLMFIIPIKMKWLGIIDAAYLAIQIILCLKIHAYATAISAIMAVLNFVVFFFMTRDYNRVNPKEIKRKKSYKREVERTVNNNIVHKCAICGRTNTDYPDLTFRFCSKCKGSYEYCQDHLFTHEHIK